MVLLAAGERGVPSRSYTPQQVKDAVCGHGRAGKDQVGRMVARLLGLSEIPSPDHAADALAVAICDLQPRAAGSRAVARAVRAVIALVSGTVAVRRGDHVVVDCGGVGYRLSVSAETLRHVPAVGNQVLLHSHIVVRDDALLLYGFATEEERELFLMLISVQSVGPKVALAVLSGGPPRELLEALAAGDTARLQAAPGVGKRTAERIIVELREKVGATAPHHGGDHRGGRQRRSARPGPGRPARARLHPGRGRRVARRRRGRAARGADRPRAEDGPPMNARRGRMR